MTKIAIVIGATGLVGEALTRMLLDHPNYAEVIVFVRNLSIGQHPKLRCLPFPTGTIDPKDLYGDELFCCLGTTIKKVGSKEAFKKVDFDLPLMFAQAARISGIKHFLIVSAIGSNKASPFLYPRIKGQLEDALIQLDFPHLTIIRPSLLLGPRKEFRLGEKVGEFVLKPLNPFFMGPLKHLKAVEASDVARILIESASRATDKVRIIESGDIPRHSARV